MEWRLRKEIADHFWNTLEDEASSRSRFPVLSRPAVHVTILAALALTFCLGGLAANKTLEGDEALYALISKTIVATGEWIRLTFNGEPYFSKPPLYFWITGALFHILPLSAFTASLGSALFGACDALLVYLLCRAMFPGWELAFASTLVYLTTHEVLHWTRGVHLETLLTFWILIGLLAAYRSVKNPSAIVGLGIAAALGWLAKGPQSLYPLAVAPLVWKREKILWRRLTSIWSVVCAAVLLAILAPWFWARLEEGAGFGEKYFIKQIFNKLFAPTLIHNGPLFYPLKLVETYWPWLPVAAIGFFILGRGWRRSLGARLWIIAAAVIALAILLTAERRTRYLFQLYPALSVAAGAAVTFAAQRYPRLLRVFVILAAAGALALTIFAGKGNRPAPSTRDAVEVARRLRSDDKVRLTQRTAHGERADSSVAKTLGFYAAPLLGACERRCEKEATAGSIVIARPEEADEVAKLLKGRVDYSNKSLTMVKIP
jgi:4-amino-4-deoxy-L-arabinose transferase-like glycosyltransferase